MKLSLALSILLLFATNAWSDTKALYCFDSVFDIGEQDSSEMTRTFLIELKLNNNSDRLERGQVRFFAPSLPYNKWGDHEWFELLLQESHDYEEYFWYLGQDFGYEGKQNKWDLNRSSLVLEKTYRGKYSSWWVSNCRLIKPEELDVFANKITSREKELKDLMWEKDREKKEEQDKKSKI